MEVTKDRALSGGRIDRSGAEYSSHIITTRHPVWLPSRFSTPALLKRTVYQVTRDLCVSTAVCALYPQVSRLSSLSRAQGFDKNQPTGETRWPQVSLYHVVCGERKCLVQHHSLSPQLYQDKMSAITKFPNFQY